MQLLAPDQSVPEAEQLAAHIRGNAERLTYQELQSQISLASTNLDTLTARHNAALDALDAAEKAYQEQEASLLITHAGVIPRSHLRQWQERIDSCRTKLAAQRGEEARIRQTLEALTGELQKRDQRREHLIRERLQAKHATQLEAKRRAAIEALASAIAAEAWTHNGMSPGDIQPLRFCAEALQEHAIRDAVLRFAAAERQQAEAEVKADKMLGGAQ